MADPTIQLYGYVNRLFTGDRSKIALLQQLEVISYSTYRTISKVPTVALTLGLMAAPIIASKWSIDLTDNGHNDLVDFAKKLEEKIGRFFRERAIFSGARYGWAGFAWTPQIENYNSRMLVFPKLKHLIPELNLILIDPKNGDFAGFRQSPAIFPPNINSSFSTDLDIPASQSIHVGFRVEGDNLYGESLLDNIISTYADYLIVNEAATRYDIKMAASQPKIGYPRGKEDVNGVLIDNAELAKQRASDLADGNGIIYPTDEIQIGELPGGPQKWDIGVYEDSNPRQGAFVERLNYLLTQMVRGLIMTERSILEGQFGTKAEAEQHTNNALAYSEYQAGIIVDAANILLDRLVYLNFGPSAVGKVKYCPAPIVDTKLEYIKSIFRDVIKDPAVVAKLDLDSIMDELGVPASSETVEPTVEPESNEEPNYATA